ncbi:MAG: urease accessory protein UreD [Parvibaculaceae bacterium]
MPDIRHPDPQWVIGKHALLNVHAKLRNGRTEIDPHAWRIPFQWQGCHYQDHDDQPFLLLINSGGGFVEGDASYFNGMLDAGTRTLVTTTAASKYYKCLSGGSCEETVDFTVGPGAVLEYLPDEAIPFAKSRIRRHTTIELAPDSRLFATDMISAGRVHFGAGEEFMFSELRSEFTIVVDGKPIISDRLLMANAEEVEELKELWAGARHMATVFCYGAEWPADIERSLETQVDEIQGVTVGASRIGGLIVVRILAEETWQAQDAIFSVWRVTRPLLCGKSARRINKC